MTTTVQTTIRTMTRTDVEPALDLLRRVSGLGADGDAGLADLLRLQAEQGETCLVAVEDEEVIGMMVGTISEWRFGAGRHGWVEAFAVAPHRMGQGLGRALGEQLLAAFSAAGVARVLTTARWDQGDALAFFKTLGFSQSEMVNLEVSTR